MKKSIVYILLLLPLTTIAQITVNVPFLVNSASPVDTRMKIAAVADTSTIVFPYAGAITYITAKDSLYLKTASGWKPIGQVTWSTLPGMPSGFADNTDDVADPDTLTLAANSLSISGGNSVSLASYLDNTDSQTLGSSYNATTNELTVNISGGNSVTIDLSDLQDAGLTQEQIEDWAGGMVSGNTETGISVTYDDAAGKLNFAVDFTGYLNSLTAGTGISISGTGSSRTITNSAPDQTVALTQGGIVTVSGTYPSFTITATEVDGSVTNEIELPSQTGNPGKFLTTNGTSPSWATVIGESTTVADSPTIDHTLTGSQISSAIITGSVANSHLANMPAYSVKTRESGTSGVPSDLTFATNTIFGRGTGNLVALTLGGILSISSGVMSATEVDGSLTNEGFLDLGAGGTNSTDLTSNTPGSYTISINGSTGIGISENLTTRSITITNTGDTNGSDDVNTSTVFGGDVTGTYSNIDINANVITATEIASNAVGNTDLADMPSYSVKVRESGTTGDPSDLTLTNNTVLGKGTGNVVALGLAGILSISAGNLTATEVDGSVTNEIELPTQTGNSGKYLTTNGTSPSWATLSGEATTVGDTPTIDLTLTGTQITAKADTSILATKYFVLQDHPEYTGYFDPAPTAPREGDIWDTGNYIKIYDGSSWVNMVIDMSFSNEGANSMTQGGAVADAILGSNTYDDQPIYFYGDDKVLVRGSQCWDLVENAPCTNNPDSIFFSIDTSVMATQYWATANDKIYDPDTLSLAGSILSISGGNSVTLPSGTTDLSVGGSSSSITIGSSTGADVNMNAGTGITFSSISNPNFTINTPWTISGSNIYKNNSGHVGINETSPTAPLVVKEQSGAASGALIGFIGDANGDGLYVKKPTAGNQYATHVYGPVKFFNGSSYFSQLIDQGGSSGSAGQVLTSGGTGAAWYWSTPSAGGGVTSVTGTAPITSSGGTTPAIGITLNSTTMENSSGLNAKNTTALWNANQLQGRSMTSTAPSTGEVIKWNGTAWAPGTDNGSGSTDLTFSGTSSPITLNSSSGTDVRFLAGTNVTLSQSGNDLTINATGGGGGVSGTGANGEIAYFTGASTLDSDPAMKFAGGQVSFGGSAPEATVTIDGTLDWDPAGSPETPTKFGMFGPNGQGSQKFFGDDHTLDGDTLKGKAPSYQTVSNGSTTWTKPYNAKYVQFICIGAGGGGGGGAYANNVAGNYAGGGQGGYSGGVSIMTYRAVDLPSSLLLVAGSGGSGGNGASGSTTNSAGTPGSSGGDSFIRNSTNSDLKYLIAKGGAGGNGGTITATPNVFTAGTANTGITSNSSVGGFGGQAFGANTTSEPPKLGVDMAAFSSYGGGGGGGMHYDGTNYWSASGASAHTISDALMAGFPTSQSQGGTSGVAPTGASFIIGYAVSGGGGAHPNQSAGTTSILRNGANGASTSTFNYGSGGGGGAGVIRNNTSTWTAGNGGSGGHGRVIAITYY